MKEQVLQLEHGAIAMLRASQRVQETKFKYNTDRVGVYYGCDGKMRRLRRIDKYVVRDAEDDGAECCDLYLYEKSVIKCSVGENVMKMSNGNTLSVECSYRIYDFPLFATAMLDRQHPLTKEPAASRAVVEAICDYLAHNKVEGVVGIDIEAELNAAAGKVMARLNAFEQIAGKGIELTSFRFIVR